MSGVASVAPNAYSNSHIYDYEYEGVECTGVNVPGVYSTFQTGGDENEVPDEPVEEEPRSPSPEPAPPPANAGLCVVTQESRAVATCSVFQLPSDGGAGFRLAQAWGFQSVESLDFHLKQSSFNRMTLRVDVIIKFGSIYGGDWALVPQVDMLDRIYQVVTTRPQNRPSNYLDEFPNLIWTYQYIPLRGEKDKLLRLVPGAKDADGTTSCTVHSFPFQRLQLQSTVHPYFATANTAQRAIYALGGRSHIPQLPAEQRNSLEMCIELYNRWLKRGVAKSSTR
ncbi:unnamed protein product [Rhizoctonia solani]|uniref:Uncharacterized protein n=1 Tax=Rhizoctonia solani TaxID=456999 RepID=A0A8H3D429_9AGAM|nr:unnamed protein product [Rhizoctonia solani]